MMDRHWSIRKRKKEIMKTSQMLEDRIINYLSGDHIELTDDQPLEDVVMHILFWHQTEGEEVKKLQLELDIVSPISIMIRSPTV
jgi:hypothetical protein